MGKGFNNYMCKKFFHPASRDNLKRVWMAEQKAESYKKKQEELRVQYEKEQDLYTNKAILSKESKDKLSVNFMYEPPPGTKKEREREDDEPEYKFEWQRKFNAPREDYCKGDSEIRDQPFGIQVRNVRCIKCHKWGHINTDKECPMYNQASSSDHSGPSLDPLVLIQQMREDGLAMKKSALSLQQHINFPGNQQLLSSDDDSNTKQSEVEFLKSLSVKQKRRLLRKLEELEKKDKNSRTGKKKKNKKKAKRKAKESEDSSDSSDSEKDTRKEKKKKKKQKNKEKKKKHIVIKRESSSSISSSSEEQNGDIALEEVLGRSIKFTGFNGKTVAIKQEPSSDDASCSRPFSSKNHKLPSSDENHVKMEKDHAKVEKERHETRRKKSDRNHKDRSSERHTNKSYKRKSSESSDDVQRKRHKH